MALSYTTPGVYVVEKSIFPPSVAEVPTAIPAFIGYTEKDTYKTAHDLNLVPTKITSLLDYNVLYGGAIQSPVTAVNLDANNAVTSVVIQTPLYMYDALQLFFANGGGDCYIISIKLYGAAILEADFKLGLDALRKKDEPALVLFPDAVMLAEAQLYDLQKYALLHCSQLQNRFCIFDTYSPTDNITAFNGFIDNIRDGLGVNNLNYGAVYTPWIKSTIQSTYTYEDIQNSLVKLGIAIKLIFLVPATDAITNGLLSEYDAIIKDKANVNTKMVADFPTLGLNPLVTKIQENVDDILSSYLTDLANFILLVNNPAPNLIAIQGAYTQLITDALLVIQFIDDCLVTAVIEIADILTEVQTLCSDLAADFKKLISLDKTVFSAHGATDYIGAIAGYPLYLTVSPGPFLNVDLQNAIAAAAPDPTLFLNNTLPLTGTAAQILAEQVQNMQKSEPFITRIFSDFHSGLQGVVDAIDQAIVAKEAALYSSFPVYKEIIDAVNNSLTILPPSGAVAGAYALTDNTRGVWKAPANVSLQAAPGVTIELTDDEQGTLNVDSNGGKSINVLRYFTGKGVIIWGARTLMGNDNEWRYVSVRRFFIMVEQSVKKSTYWAVFEPNDANTWTKVKGMIENFLNIQWRNGALQGAKPDDAFYVKVGLGQTMTAIDILEGRLIVQIGMAVVRPAEFIVLTFMHKLVTSS